MFALRNFFFFRSVDGQGVSFRCVMLSDFFYRKVNENMLFKTNVQCSIVLYIGQLRQVNIKLLVLNHSGLNSPLWFNTVLLERQIL